MAELREGNRTSDNYTLFKTFPMNSAIPAINKDHNGNEKASVLIVADNDMREHFRASKNKNLDIQVSTYLKDSHNDGKKDLIIRVDFFFQKAHGIYEAVIAGDLGNQQKDYIRVLKNSDVIDIWITDIDGSIERIVPIDWNFNKAQTALKELM